MTYTPMPSQLNPQLQSIVRELSGSQPDADITIGVIREALAQAYAAGHRDGHAQIASHQWLVEDLRKVFDNRKATPNTAPREKDHHA